jgi:hypothetical protein
MDSSGPSRYSSITISSPAAPNSLSTKTAFNACSASCLVSGKSTPFPAANPEAFKTTRSNPHEARYARASSYWEAVNDRKPAVGIAWRSIKSLERVLEPSRSAASGEGPKTGMPAAGGLAMLQRGRPGPTREAATHLFGRPVRRRLRAAVQGREYTSRPGRRVSVNVHVQKRFSVASPRSQSRVQELTKQKRQLRRYSVSH